MLKIEISEEEARKENVKGIIFFFFDFFLYSAVKKNCFHFHMF